MRLSRFAVVALSVALLQEGATTAVVCGQDSGEPASANIAPTPGNASGSSTATAGGLDLNMNLEQLTRQDVVVPGLSTPVTTVERQPSTIGRTPAAVFVITPEMIKRSGARTIPDVLRMAPGVDVARINAHSWAISIRGFNNRFANKLLVQIDGRVVYNTTFGGVYWDMQDLVLEDIERIEVIRGPGTTMWGSNAVNGVINIITKKSSDTQGVLVQSGGGGEQERDFNTVRYGNTTSAGVSWRVWGQQFDRAPGWSDVGVNDAWHMKHGGFRIDYAPNEEDTVTLQGDLSNGFGGQRTDGIAIPTPPFDVDENNPLYFPTGNVLFRYGRVFDDETSWQLQTYYDRYVNNDLPVLKETRDTYEVDFQYQFSPAPCHQFITGVNYRSSSDSFENSFAAAFDPPKFTTEWFSIFAQDTMTVEEDYCYFTLGLRLEQNTFGGFQAEPTGRLLFLPSERQSLWMAISRAARNPTRSNTGLDVKAHLGPPFLPLFLDILGNPTIEAENLVAYEIGYRAAPTDNFSWDIAGFLNDYNKLVGLGPVGPPVFQPPGFILLPAEFENNTRARSYGFETTATFQLTDDWRFFASYSLFEVEAQGASASSVGRIEGSNPNNQIYLRSSWDLGQDVQLDLIGRYVDALTGLDVPQYFEMDARIGWQATKTLELSFVGQNLLDSHHLEFVDASGLVSTQVRRSWYGMLTWKF